MVDVKKITDLSQLAKYLDDNGIFEIAIRQKNKRFKAFEKITLDNCANNHEQIYAFNNLMQQFKQNNVLNLKSMNILNNVATLSSLNLLMNGLNLCATCAAFIIISQKIDKLGEKIDKVLSVIKTSNEINLNYEFKKCISEHKKMLDHRKTQDYFSLRQMEDLVSAEYNVLSLMVDYFIKSQVINDKQTILYSIMTLASMLSISTIYYDEMYYFEYKEKIKNENFWHLEHQEWTGIFDKISSSYFLSKIQDIGFLELNLSTKECDAFYVNVKDNALYYKQDILDNQDLLSKLDDKEKYDQFFYDINSDVISAITKMINESDESLDISLKESMNKSLKQVVYAY